ncbi:unnamed protein product, partial [Oikopleura dioica]
MNRQGPEWERRETARIFNKYKTGVPDPEDEEELISIDGKVPDQFGFYETQLYKQYEEKLLNSNKRTIKRREKKWKKMLNQYQKNLKKKLPDRVFKGVPNSVRRAFWDAALNPIAVKQHYNEQGAQFKFLYASKKDDVEVVRQIDLDIKRTWRLHQKFFKLYGRDQRACFRILLAYAALDTEVAYCQGMSQIAALFMIVFEDEEKAFWSLVAIMNKVPWSQSGMFKPGFPKLNLFCAYWDNTLQKHLSKVYKHLEAETLISQIYLTKWLLQNFLDRMPFRLAIRLWDCYILKGDVVVLAATFVLFKLNQRKILQMSFEDLTPFLQNDICNLSIPDDTFFQQVKKAIPLVRAMMTNQQRSELPTFDRTKSLPNRSRPKEEPSNRNKIRTLDINIDPESTSMPKRQINPIETPVPKARHKRPKKDPKIILTSPKSPSKSVASLNTVSSKNGYHFDTSKPVKRVEVMPSRIQASSFLKHSHNYEELIQNKILDESGDSLAGSRE